MTGQARWNQSNSLRRNSGNDGSKVEDGRIMRHAIERPHVSYEVRSSLGPVCVCQLSNALLRELFHLEAHLLGVKRRKASSADLAEVGGVGRERLV